MGANERERELWLVSLGLAVLAVGAFIVPVALALGLAVARAVLGG